jgi:hypothetical protein
LPAAGLAELRQRGSGVLGKREYETCLLFAWKAHASLGAVHSALNLPTKSRICFTQRVVLLGTTRTRLPQGRNFSLAFLFDFLTCPVFFTRSESVAGISAPSAAGNQGLGLIEPHGIRSDPGRKVWLRMRCVDSNKLSYF